tara:strand:- start:4748 stop:7138 length:2391 start_codon:yes stop_codon:yes gene_type:complete
MARIPTLQRRATLPTTTGVPAAPVVLTDDQTGQGLQQVGGVVSEIGENQLRARADAMVTQSYVNATLKMDELKESIGTNKTLSWESDPNSSQFNPGAVAPTADPDDVKARMAQIYETASEGLSPYGLEKFKKDYSMLSAKGQIEIRREQVTRDNAELQAHNLAILDTLVRGSTKDGTDAVWVASLKKGIESIDSLEFNRQIGPKKAETLRQKFRAQMDKVKGDRLTVGIELVEADGLRTVDIDEEDSAPKERLDKLDAAIKEAVEFGAITRTKGTQIRLAFLRKVDDAMAHQQVEANAATFLKLEKDSSYLPNLESKQRSQYAKRARTIIEQEERQTKTAANAKERTFVKAASDVIEALSVAANITPELESQVNDAAIDANVQDATTREKLKLLREDAKDFAGVVASIAGKTPAEILALEQQLTADLQGERGTVAQASLAEQDRRQLDAFLRAKAADSKARLDDPALYVVSNNGAVGEAYTVWASAIQNPRSDENIVAIMYANYQAAREEAYSLGGFPPDARTRLPKSFVRAQVALAQEASAEDIAKNFDNMSDQMGSDWPFMLRELVAEGLPEAAGAIAIVENPQARDTLAKIVQAGGYKELTKTVDPADKTSMDKTIDAEMRKLREVAGAGNIYMVNSLREATRLLAANSFLGGESQNAAVEKALKVVVRDNYQIIDDQYVKGIIPVGTVDKPRQLTSALRRYMRDDENLENINIAGFPGGDDDIKRKWLRQNARWTFTPDGQQLELRGRSGTPVEDLEGNPVTLPLGAVTAMAVTLDSDASFPTTQQQFLKQQ